MVGWVGSHNEVGMYEVQVKLELGHSVHTQHILKNEMSKLLHFYELLMLLGLTKTKSVFFSFPFDHFTIRYR